MPLPLTRMVLLYGCLGLFVGGNQATAEPASAGVAYRTALFSEGRKQSAGLETGTACLDGGNLVCSSAQDVLKWSSVTADLNLRLEIQAAGKSCGTVPVCVTTHQTECGRTCRQTVRLGLPLPADGQWGTLSVQIRGGSSWNIQLTDPQGKTRTQHMLPGSLPRCDQLTLAFETSTESPVRIRKIELEEPGFRSLFNGQDLSEWESSGGSLDGIWSVLQGTIACSGKKGAWLRSKQEYGDFHLKFEYQLKAAGNSGLYVRVPKDGNHHRAEETLPPAGLEIQLLDDAAAEYRELKPYQYSASLYDIVGAEPRVSRPAGEWNTFELDVRSRHYRIWHNGVAVVDTDANHHPLLNLRKVSGFLGLQNHSSVIQFRHLRIRESLGRD